MDKKTQPVTVSIEPVTPDRWPDLENLFGEKGAYAGCWCMFWRVKSADFRQMQGQAAHAALREITLAGKVPGLLAYADGKPVGWCSLGPREDFTALERSKTLKRIDDQPVWSIVCFFIRSGFRRQGVMTQLIQGAVNYALSQGAKIIEAYPIDTQAQRYKEHRLTGCSGYTGIASTFINAGFVEAARPNEYQVILRYTRPE